MSNNSSGGQNSFPVPKMNEVDLGSVLKALSDPVRLGIVRRLSDDEYHPCNVEEYDVNIHKSTLSYHFKTLREAGITATLVSGREHSVKLRRSDLNDRFPGLIEAVIANVRPPTGSPGE